MHSKHIMPVHLGQHNDLQEERNGDRCFTYDVLCTCQIKYSKNEEYQEHAACINSTVYLRIIQFV